MGAPTSTLRDNFDSVALANCWPTAVFGSATVAQTSSQLRFTLPSSVAGSHGAFVQTPAVYDLTGDGFYINIQTMVSTAVVATAYFDLRLDSANYFRWVQQSNIIYASKQVAGAPANLFSATWSASTYKYLRIRESGGTIFFDSSTNGTSWTNRAQIVGLPFAVTNLSIVLGADCGNVASPGSFRLDDVNLILPALSTAWNWQQQKWSLAHRFKVVTLAIDAAGTAQGYVVTADGVDATDAPSGNVRYWSGPADGGRELTEQVSLAAAQAMAVNLPLDGRFDLPTMVEARCIRTYNRSIDAAAYLLREDYARRLIQSDDIEAEAIRTLNLAAGAVTADKIFVVELSAITADVGLLTAGIIDGVTIYAGGVGRPLTLDVSGMWLVQTTNYDNERIIRWMRSGVLAGYVGNVNASGGTLNETTLAAIGTTNSTYGTSKLYASGKNGAGATVNIVTVQASGYDNTIYLTSGLTSISGTINALAGINVGNVASGAGVGQISTDGSVAIGEPINSVTRLHVKGMGNTASSYNIVTINSASTAEFYVQDNGVGFINSSAWLYSSDASRKRNIRALGRDIAHLMQIKPVRFDYIDGPEDRMGFIAQDVQAVFPELVEVLPDGTLGMRTDELLPVMLKAFNRLIRLLITKNVITAADVAGVEPEP